ncbi:MAG: FAD-dependent oxidoreductase, partial [Pseudomonadota bacterium]
MQRIFSSYAYGAGPRTGCWWDETCDMPTGDPLDDTACDVAIVGGGFTGITAALWLARAGVR